MKLSDRVSYLTTDRFGTIHPQFVLIDESRKVGYVHLTYFSRSMFKNHMQANANIRKHVNAFRNQDILDYFNSNLEEVRKVYGDLVQIKHMPTKTLFITARSMVKILELADQIQPDIDQDRINATLDTFKQNLKENSVSLATQIRAVKNRSVSDKVMAKYLEWIRAQVQQENLTSITAKREQLYRDHVLQHVDNYYLQQKQLIMAQIERDKDLVEEVVEELCQRPDIQQRAKQHVDAHRVIGSVAKKAPYKPPQ